MVKFHRLGIAIAVLGLAWGGCDHGFEPPDAPFTGTIQAAITYVGDWPPQEEFHDLRLVAMRFVPRDTADFLQLNRMAISESLEYGLPADTVILSGVETGAFVYSGLAQHFDSDLLAWRPIGLYVENDGIFFVTENDTTKISLLVDFDQPPPFPPSKR